MMQMHTIGLGITVLVSLGVACLPGKGSTESSTDTSSSGSGGVCGDGVLDPNESCDDANSDDGDGCNASCQSEFSFRWCEFDIDGSDDGSASSSVHDLDVGPGGEIAVITRVGYFGEGVVHKFNGDAQFEWVRKQDAVEGPTSIAFRADGSLAVSGTLTLWSGDVGTPGAYVTLLSVEGDSLEWRLLGDGSAGRIAIHPEGVVTAFVPYSNSSNVRWFDGSLEVGSMVSTQLRSPAALAVDGTGRTFLALNGHSDEGTQSIRYSEIIAFSADATQLWSLPIEEQGQDREVRDLAIGPAGLVVGVQETPPSRVSVDLDSGQLLATVSLEASGITSLSRLRPISDEPSTDYLLAGYRVEEGDVWRGTLARMGKSGTLVWTTPVPTGELSTGSMIGPAKSEFDDTFVIAGRLGPDRELWICKFTP
ncbi:MAG TPA: hypothetical protein ENJ18_16855 [Nannocystis exedens]|nr:hypothetical protein [Nannocystis exedens]